jgi:1-phosphatidylinositol phosphodiesterase
MKLTLLNLTTESLSCRPLTYYSKPVKGQESELLVVEPSCTTTTTLPQCCTRLTVLPLASNASLETAAKEWTIHPEGLLIRVSLWLGASWHVIAVPDWCPWRMYLTRVSETRSSAFNNTSQLRVGRERPPHPYHLSKEKCCFVFVRDA